MICQCFCVCLLLYCYEAFLGAKFAGVSLCINHLPIFFQLIFRRDIRREHVPVLCTCCMSPTVKVRAVLPESLPCTSLREQKALFRDTINYVSSQPNDDNGWAASTVSEVASIQSVQRAKGAAFGAEICTMAVSLTRGVLWWVREILYIWPWVAHLAL